MKTFQKNKDRKHHDRPTQPLTMDILRKDHHSPRRIMMHVKKWGQEVFSIGMGTFTAPTQKKNGMLCHKKNKNYLQIMLFLPKQKRKY